MSAVVGIVLAMAPAVPAALAPPSCNGEFATVWGDAGDNLLIGTAGDDIIQGLGGDDTIQGLAGNDMLCGGGGDDTIEGGPGNDLIFGGSGHDLIRGQGGRDAIAGLPGNDRLLGGLARDVILGNKGNDLMWGRSGGDYIQGDAGIDGANGGIHVDWCRTENRISCEGPIGPWRLHYNGIGHITFGTPTDFALVELALLGDPMFGGQPDEDSGWVPSFGVWGTCPNDQVRVVRWGNLRTYFTRTGLTEGEFFTWQVVTGFPDERLATTRGLRHGDTRGQLELLYNNVHVEFFEPFSSWLFYVGNNPSGVSGTLTDGSIGATISHLQGGIGCGE